MSPLSEFPLVTRFVGRNIRCNGPCLNSYMQRGELLRGLIRDAQEISARIGHPAEIRAAEPRKQQHNWRDTDLILTLLVEDRFPRRSGYLRRSSETCVHSCSAIISGSGRGVKMRCRLLPWPMVYDEVTLLEPRRAKHPREFVNRPSLSVQQLAMATNSAANAAFLPARDVCRTSEFPLGRFLQRRTSYPPWRKTVVSGKG